MVTRPDNLIYAQNEKPPLGKWLILGLQQVCVLSIYFLLVIVVTRAAHVPQNEIQSYVSFAMLAIAIGSALQALPIGSGYLAPPVISAIYLNPSLLAVGKGGLPLVFGMTIIAGLFEMLISYLFHFLRQLFPPIISGLIVIAVGFELGFIGTDQLLYVKGLNSDSDFKAHILASAVTLVSIIALTVWGRGIVRLISALLGIGIGWVVAYFLNLIPPSDLSYIVESPIIGFPKFGVIAYDFDFQLVIPFMIAGLAAALRTIGVVTTCQKINDSSWKRPESGSIKRGIFADGLGCMITGLIGAPGSSSSPSAVGISQFTLATSRYIAFAVAAWLVLFAFCPKMTAVFIAIPMSVVGATLLYTGSMMLVSGIQIITSQPIDVRKTFIIGLSLFLGLSHKLFPDYFKQLPGWIQVFTGTILSITTVVSLILNALFRFRTEKSATVLLESNLQTDELDKILSEKVKKWGGNIEDAKNASSFVDAIVKMISDHHLADGPIKVHVTYDDILLKIDLNYQGQQLNLPVHRPQNEEHLLDEMPMSVGLSGFLVGIYPDEIKTSSHGAECHIQLAFEA